MAAKKNKRPKAPLAPVEEKKPRANAQNVRTMSPLWAFRIADLRGPWCWSRLDGDTQLEVLRRLGSLETMTWADIVQGTGSHPISLGDLIKPAQERLIEIGQDDVDELFSLRVSGKCRIWGIRDNEVLRVLWCDPEHEVCPSLKKHT